MSAEPDMKPEREFKSAKFLFFFFSASIGRKMSTVRISWDGELSEEQVDVLNDSLNLMGMQAAADQGVIPQEMVDDEVDRLEMKYNPEQM